MPARTYGTITKSFHWTTALLILAVVPLGAIANDMPYDTSDQLAQKAWLFSLHKTLGVTVFLVALLRILWALTQPKPAPLHPDRKAETLLAEIIHWLLYISLVGVPLTGWIHHAATAGFAPIWWPFGQDLPLVPKSDTIAHLFASLHWLLSKVMIGSILLHVAGALKHQFIDRDATLRRMWFGKGDIPQAAAHDSSRAAPAIAVAVTLAAIGAGAVMASNSTAEGPAVAALEEVVSDWQVTEGTLSIEVTQLGSAVTGSFADWTAQISFDPGAGPEFGSVDVTIAIGSLTLGSVTSQAMGADFFAAEQFPTARFTGPITATGTGYEVAGSLTVKGVTAPVTLPFDLALDGDTATMTGRTRVDRLTFNVGESMPDETNLGFTVVINAALTATRAAQ